MKKGRDVTDHRSQLAMVGDLRDRQKATSLLVLSDPPSVRDAQVLE
jgi:hypothetical protein